MKTSLYLLFLFVMSAFSVHIFEHEYVKLSQPKHQPPSFQDEKILQNKCKLLLDKINHQNQMVAIENETLSKTIKSIKSQNDTIKDTIHTQELHSKYCYEE